MSQTVTDPLFATLLRKVDSARKLDHVATVFSTLTFPSVLAAVVLPFVWGWWGFVPSVALALALSRLSYLCQRRAIRELAIKDPGAYKLLLLQGVIALDGGPPNRGHAGESAGVSDAVSEVRILAWQDVEPAAEEVFSIWTGQPELHWARQAWDVIVRAGLARYRTELERCNVGIRLLALGGLYHDFCRIAHEESIPPEYEAWATALDITAFRVGQLIGQHPDWDDEADDTESGLRFLADRERPAVVRVLRDGLGGDTGLFLSLWRSSRELDEASDVEPDDEPDQETDDDILNVVTPDKMAAFEWIEGGCESVYWE